MQQQEADVGQHLLRTSPHEHPLLAHLPLYVCAAGAYTNLVKLQMQQQEANMEQHMFRISPRVHPLLAHLLLCGPHMLQAPTPTL
jgi:hypothetical protein